MPHNFALSASCVSCVMLIWDTADGSVPGTIPHTVSGVLLLKSHHRLLLKCSKLAHGCYKQETKEV